MRETRFIVLAMVATMLLACAQFGGVTPQTFNQKVLAAQTTATTVLKLNDDLLLGKQITAADATNIEKQADNLQAGIDIARQVHATNPTAGDAKLQAVLTALQALQSYLATQGGKTP